MTERSRSQGWRGLRDAFLTPVANDTREALLRASDSLPPRCAPGTSSSADSTRVSSRLEGGLGEMSALGLRERCYETLRSESPRSAA